MADDLKPVHRLVLWRLIGAGGGDWLKSISPEPKPAVRKLLEQKGLIEALTVRNPSSGRSCLRLEVTDQGWQWAAAHMDERVGASPCASEALHLVLSALNDFFQHEGLTPAEIFRQTARSNRASGFGSGKPKNGGRHPGIRRLSDRPSNGENFPGESPFYPSIPVPIVEASIKRAYLELTAGIPEKKVRLAYLRQRVDLPKDDFDAVLTQMVREDKVVLDAIPNLSEITEEDQRAAVRMVPGGEQHLVALKSS